MGLESILNATNGFSNTSGQSSGSSWGASGSSASSSSHGWSIGKSHSEYSDVADSYNLGDSWGWTDGASLSSSQEESGSYGWSQGRTYGREASAQDIENAAAANQIQRDLWSEQAAYNAKQAEIDREYQAYMSNTAYQRAVVDLLKAGLNPILAAGNMGASTPVGAMATSGLASAAKANAYAEQTSSSENRSWSKGSSQSSSYNRGQNGSHSEGASHSEGSGYSNSWNKSKESSHSNSSSWSKEGSKNQSSSNGHSETTTQLKELGNMVNDIITGGSAQKALEGIGRKTGGQYKQPGQGNFDGYNSSGARKF